MPKPYDYKAVIKENIAVLLNYAEKKNMEWDSAKRLAKKAKVGHMTIYRMLEGQAAKLDQLERVAAVFKLQAWQLLIPGLDPQHPPIVVNTLRERLVLEAMRQDGEEEAETETTDASPDRADHGSPAYRRRPGRSAGSAHGNTQAVRPKTRAKAQVIK